MAPKALQNQNLSSKSFLLCERSAETSPKVLKNTGEPLGARTCLLRTGSFFSHIRPGSEVRPEKAHKHLAHKQFLGHPGHRSSRPGTRFLPAGDPDENVYVPWVPHTAHKLLTPGHRSGDPVGRPPPRPGSHRKNLFMFMCLFLS